MTHEHDSTPEMESARLISRVVDGEATGAEWQSFCRLADVDPVLWRELAETQHQQSELSAHVMRALEIADHVEVPVQEEMVYRFHERVRAAVVVGGWAGWAAAAAVALVAWGVGLPGISGASRIGPGNEVLTAGVPGGGWAEALQAYLERGQKSGQVLGELPEKVLLDARTVPSTGADGGGRYEVIYLRQIMERAVVNEVMGVGTDDLGRPVPVRIHVAPSVDPRPM